MLSAAGSRYSETPRTGAQIKTYADAVADMFCAHLANLQQAPAKRSRRSPAAAKAETTPTARRRSVRAVRP